MLQVGIVSFVLFILFAFVKAELPKALSVEYEIKTASLLGTTMEVGIISAQADQDLYRLDSVVCPPYDCASENIGCLCDYTHNAVGGCGSSSDSSCTCENKDEYCSMSWIDLQDDVPVHFEGGLDELINFRYYLNECKAARVCIIIPTISVVYLNLFSDCG
jgi:hypothetical protein